MSADITTHANANNASTVTANAIGLVFCGCAHAILYPCTVHAHTNKHTTNSPDIRLDPFVLNQVLNLSAVWAGTRINVDHFDDFVLFDRLYPVALADMQIPMGYLDLMISVRSTMDVMVHESGVADVSAVNYVTMTSVMLLLWFFFV